MKQGNILKDQSEPKIARAHIIACMHACMYLNIQILDLADYY